MKINFKILKERIFKSLGKNVSMIIYAVLLAIIAWFFVSATIYPTATINVADIPITIDLEGTSASRNELSVVSQEFQNVTAHIEGSRAIIGNLKAEDLQANVIIDNIAVAGEYELPIVITSKKEKDFDVIAINPNDKVKVRFDRIITKSIEVVAEAPNIVVEDGYIKNDITCSPNTIEIKGPEDQLNKITKCVVKTEDNKKGEKLTSSYELTSSELVLYNNNTILAQDDFTINTTNFAITVNVFMKKTLPFKLLFKPDTIPSGFPIDDMQFTMDIGEIEVAAPNNSIENIEAISLGYMDLREVDIGTVKVFPVELPTGYTNLTGTQNVTITFRSEGLAKKKFDIKASSISIVNAPPQYTITPVNWGFSGVTFVGDEEILKDLTVQDIVAQMDFLNANITVQNDNYFNAPVSFFVQDKGCVWALSSHTATFKAKDSQDAP